MKLVLVKCAIFALQLPWADVYTVPVIWIEFVDKDLIVFTVNGYGIHWMASLHGLSHEVSVFTFEPTRLGSRVSRFNDSI